MCLYRNENLSPSPLTTYSANRLTAIGLVWIIGFDCYWDRLYILEVPAEVVFSPVKQSRYWYILSGRVAGPGINVWFVYQSTLHAWTLQPEQWLPDVSMPQSSKEADCIGNKNTCLSVNFLSIQSDWQRLIANNSIYLIWSKIFACKKESYVCSLHPNWFVWVT